MHRMLRNVIRFSHGLDRIASVLSGVAIVVLGVEDVADHAAAMTLALARRLCTFDKGIRDGRWKIGDMVQGLRSLRDTNVGLIGMGRIARAYAERMAAFGCRLSGYDPHVTVQQASEAGIEPRPLDEVIAGANVLSLHLPLTPETRHMIDKETLGKLPAGAILINCSRGGLVDETALAAALQTGQVAGAGLDVLETEPLPSDSPLRDAPNLIMSPHAAFYSDKAVDRLQQLASEEALRGLRGEPLRCPLI